MTRNSISRPAIPAASKAGEDREQKRAGLRRDQCRAIGPDHVERAMREIDDVHDAEDERQSRRQQEQHDAELHAVQKLLERERHRGQHVMSAIP